MLQQRTDLAAKGHFNGPAGADSDKHYDDIPAQLGHSRDFCPPRAVSIQRGIRIHETQKTHVRLVPGARWEPGCGAPEIARPCVIGPSPGRRRVELSRRRLGGV